MSLTPLNLQTAFLNIKKSRVPDAAYRGHMFENSIKALAEWWALEFFRIQKVGHIQSYTYEEVRTLLKSGDYEFDENYELAYASFEGHEIVKTPKSLMKHALMRSGSRDVSTQLFTALCRALDIPARLVVSLQSVPWKTSAGKLTTNAKRGSKPDTPADSGDSVEGVPIPAIRDIKGKGRAIDSDGGYVMSDGSRSSAASSPSFDGKGKGKGKQKATPTIRLRKSRLKPSAQETLEGIAQISLSYITIDWYYPKTTQIRRWSPRQCGQKSFRVQIVVGCLSTRRGRLSINARYLILLTPTLQRKGETPAIGCST